MRRAAKVDANQTAIVAAQCPCRACIRLYDAPLIARGEIPQEFSRMIVCCICGNKRCPHANNHRNACTASNAPGQKWSAYE